MKIEATQFPSVASQEGSFAGSSAQAKPKKDEQGLFGKCRSFLNKHSTVVDSIQLGLDIAGMIPAVGAVADLANAGIAAARGNYVEAGLSLAASVPVVGQAAAGSKLGAKAAKYAGKGTKYASKAGKFIPKADKVVDAVKFVGKHGTEFVAKHGNKIKKSAKGAKGALLGFGAYSGVKAAKGEVAEGDWINAARSAVGVFEVGKAVTSSRTVKAVKDSVADSLGDLGKNMKLKMVDKVDEVMPRVVSDSNGQSRIVSGKQYKELSEASVSKIEADGPSGGGSKKLDDSVKQISEADRIKINCWEYTPRDELYLKYKNVYDNLKYYDQSTGTIHWPENDGFLEDTIENIKVDQSVIFKRYGEPNGEFLGNAIDSFESRSLAPHSQGSNEYYYRPVERFNITSGKAAPWFGSKGGAEQFVKYKTDGTRYSIQELLDKGLIEDITDLVKKGEVKID